MTESLQSGSSNYRPRLRDIALWAGAIAVLWGFDTVTKLEDRKRLGVGLDDFRLYTEQATSAIAVLVMVWFVARWLAWFPIDRHLLLRTIAALVAGSVLFTVGHYALMVAMRIAVFAVNGVPYILGWQHFGNLMFEYQKDIKIYGAIVGVIAVRQYFLRQNSNAAAVPDDSANSSMLLVQTGSGERLIDVAQVQYLQAARNYVSVYVDNREYLIRETLASLAARLARGQFLRTHRSYIVNLAHVADLRPTDSGVWEVRLNSGASIPLSRGYRDAVRARVRRAAGISATD